MTTCRRLKAEEMPILIHWAASEGWNPGLDDHVAFFHADPDGFFAVCEDNKPVACVSVVKQGLQSDYAFLGLYICHPDYRGKGLGWQAWQAGMDYASDCSIGLDGVVEQQANYQKSGFQPAYRNIRFTGSVNRQHQGQPKAMPQQLRSNVEIKTLTGSDVQGLIDMDTEIGGIHRSRYLGHWFEDTQHRHSLVAVNRKDKTLCGVGTIRQCRENHKIGPLLADDPDIAMDLLDHLISTATAEVVTIDIPEPNELALAVVESLNLSPVFETSRMYRGTRPEQQLNRLFGVATFELG